MPLQHLGAKCKLPTRNSEEPIILIGKPTESGETFALDITYGSEIMDLVGPMNPVEPMDPVELLIL